MNPADVLGAYRILDKIGQGGMGEVYRARDTKLNRDVAIKVLPELFAADPERLARFTREAQTLASLNHSNIAQIYGVLDHPAALVMEFADGEDLSAIIARGPLPTADALAITRQIADALEVAHEQGIVHRDLKPGNIKVKPDGTVKVLDFGLAKAMDPSAGPEGLAYDIVNSPTFTAHATQMGVILGTAAYMAPEQARGKTVDKRADIWAFGVVLFEMLTGRQTFGGDTISDVMAAVMKDDPDWTRLPPNLPPQVVRLLKRCLVKDPKQRLRDIGDARLLLEDTEAPAPSLVDASRWPRRGSIGVVPAIAITIAGMIAAGAAVNLWWRGSSNIGRIASPHLHIVLPPGDELTNPDLAPLAVSPDGSRVAYSAEHAGVRQLFVRALEDAEPKALPGTEGGGSPFFSPDGQWIGFFAELKLKKVDVGGTTVQVLCDVASARGGTWSPDGQIYFAPGNVSGLEKVSENGGAPARVTTPNHDSGEISHRWPLVLPDGKTLIFTVWTGPGPDEREIVRMSLPAGERQVLVRGGDRARVVDGYLIYVRLDGLFVTPWQASNAAASTAAPIALRETARIENEGAGAYDVAANGTLVTVAGGRARYAQRLVWVSRDGKIEALPLPERDYESVWLSPDGSRALVQIREGAIGLWLYDFARHTLTPLSVAAGSSQAGGWTPDGRRIVYRGTRKGTRQLYWRAADGTGDEQQLTTGAGSQSLGSISQDGKWLVYNDLGGKFGTGTLYTIRLDGSLPADGTVLVNGAINGQLSPDGRWIAYSANVSNRSEIFVQAFPELGARTQISTDGGVEALWAPDGRELYYQAGDRLMAVSISTKPMLSAGEPRLVVRGRFRPGPNAKTAFSVDANGRFLRVQQVEPERPLNRLDVVLNWIAEVKKAAATR